jgi:hypothetical protein
VLPKLWRASLQKSVERADTAVARQMVGVEATQVNLTAVMAKCNFPGELDPAEDD